MVQAWQTHMQRAWCTRSLGWVGCKAFRNSCIYLFCWVWGNGWGLIVTGPGLPSPAQ